VEVFGNGERRTLLMISDYEEEDKVCLLCAGNEDTNTCSKLLVVRVFFVCRCGGD
jgi:hypothetical protein